MASTFPHTTTDAESAAEQSHDINGTEDTDCEILHSSQRLIHRHLIESAGRGRDASSSEHSS